MIATAGSLLVVLGLVRGPEVGWGSIQGAGSAVAGAALLGVFLLVERFTRDPLVPSRMFGVRGLVAAMGLIFIVMGPVTALHYLYTTYMQDVLGYEALVAGLGFLPQGLVAMAGSALLLPFLLERWGLRVTMFVGMVGVGATSAAFAAGMSVTGSYWTLLPALLLLGLTAGTLYPAIFTAAGTGVRPEEGGVASAMTSTAQQIGAAVGLAALVAVANAGLETGGTTAAVEVVDGLRAAGWAGAVATVAGAFIALAIRRAPRSARPEPAASPEGTGRAAAPST